MAAGLAVEAVVAATGAAAARAVAMVEDSAAGTAIVAIVVDRAVVVAEDAAATAGKSRRIIVKRRRHPAPLLFLYNRFKNRTVADIPRREPGAACPNRASCDPRGMGLQSVCLPEVRC